ncbi:DUF2490 domain-containing protein [Costertonia aggregata]|uniref:DUF2490 domain-containing protein n=1 Tax=Costertonia aggregata TaxID=343403 RepID=A0A7H9AMW9_9FLAO|nr:DUF2490 domain-containing protein [Costertonia aggregata]QLG44744.1 DUF2490 domain-containing protein [Costertonia aggregata]
MKNIYLKALWVLSLIVFANTCKAQIKANQFNSWWYYSGTYQFNERFSTNLLYAWSRHDFVKEWQISKLGLSGNYNLSKNFGVGLSYEWAIIFPYGELPVPEKRVEHRFLERFYFRDKVGKFSIGSTIEMEQFFRNGEFLQRARLRAGFRFPLLRNDESRQLLGMSFFELIFIAMGGGQEATLTQNRIYGGFDIALSKNLTLGLGYLNQYIIIRPEIIENDHTLLVGLFHRISFKKD